MREISELKGIVKTIQKNGAVVMEFSRAAAAIDRQTGCRAAGGENKTLNPVLASGFITDDMLAVKSFLEVEKTDKQMYFLEKLLVPGANEPVNARELIGVLDGLRIEVGAWNHERMLEVAEAIGKKEAFEKERVSVGSMSRLWLAIVGFDNHRKESRAKEWREKWRETVARRDTLHARYAGLGHELGGSVKNDPKRECRTVEELEEEIQLLEGLNKRREETLNKRALAEKAQAELEGTLAALVNEAMPLAKKIGHELVLSGSHAERVAQLQDLLPVLRRSVARLNAAPFVAKGGGAKRGSRTNGKTARRKAAANSAGGKFDADEETAPVEDVAEEDGEIRSAAVG